MNKYQLRQLPLTIAIGSTLAAGSLQAATITVDNAGDGPVGSLPGVCTLRSAIEAANTNAVVDGCVSGDAGADLIEFDAALAGSTVELSSQITISESVSMIGPVPDDASGVTIDANLGSRHFYLPGTYANSLDVSLNGLSLIDGRPQGSGGAIFATYARLNLSHVDLLANEAQSASGGSFEARGSGGAIALRGGALTLSDGVVNYNRASGFFGGGGLYVADTASLSVTNSTINANAADLNGGGVLIFGSSGTAYTDTAVQIAGTTIDGNTAEGNGGGVSVQQQGLGFDSLDLTITDSSISGNTSNRNGGGLYVSAEYLASDIRFERVEINGNRIDGLPGSFTGFSSGGAGVSIADFSTFSLIDSEVRSNVAVASVGPNPGTASGGGLNILSCYGGIEIRDSVISSNTIVADRLQGAGLLVNFCRGDIVNSEISGNLLQPRPHPDSYITAAGIANVSRPIDIVNSSIVGNQIGYLTADQAGTPAGLNLEFGSSITHSTIAGNRVTYGAVTGSSVGLRTFGTPEPVTLTNTIISGPANADACTDAQYIDDLGGNLVTDATCTGVVTNPADLALGPLDDNGGPTRTMALGAGSVAIDAAGDCRTTLGIEMDQRGVARGRLCDVGAFEVFEDVIFSDRFEGALP